MQCTKYKVLSTKYKVPSTYLVQRTKYKVQSTFKTKIAVGRRALLPSTFFTRRWIFDMERSLPAVGRRAFLPSTFFTQRWIFDMERSAKKIE
jgi:hypothetical protein